MKKSQNSINNQFKEQACQTEMSHSDFQVSSKFSDNLTLMMAHIKKEVNEDIGIVKGCMK